MKSICIRDKDDILVIDKSDIDIKKIFDFFLQYKNRTVYVSDREVFGDDRIIGIITQGDFLRYVKQKAPLFNEKFMKCILDKEEDVVRIFNEKQKIWSVPVIDEEGKLVKEYYRCGEEKQTEEATFQILVDMYQEALLSRAEISIFILGGSFSKKQKEIANDISKKTKGRVIIRDVFLVEELLVMHEKHYIRIYDMRIDRKNLCRALYDEFKINHVCISEERIMMMNSIGELSRLFKTVGVFSCNYDMKKRIENAPWCIKQIEIERLFWNEESACYEYLGKECGEVEVIFSFVQISDKLSYIQMGEKRVPIISIMSDNTNQPDVEIQILDEDVAFNIVPKLQENNVKCIVIDNVQNDYDALEEKDKFNISHRTLDGLMNRAVGGTEHEIFWSAQGEYNELLLKELNDWCTIFKDGFLQQANMYGKYVNYVNGERYTFGNPQTYRNTLFIFGPCIVMGRYVSDEETLGSYLRQYISQKYYIKNCGGGWQVMNYLMRMSSYQPGDIVVIFAYNRKPYEINGIKVHNIWDLYQKIPNIQDNIWDTMYHCNGVVTRYLAKRIKDLIQEEEIIDVYGEGDICGDRLVKFGIEQGDKSFFEGVKQYLESVKHYKVYTEGVSGGIVMNCNPFTKGHRYLIEEAAKKVDVLYIFVVEENKSYFKFEDRINLVRIGVSDLENVVVIPSGKFIVSSATLPGYFEKEKKQTVEFDATDDLEIFGKIIAKEFNITIRFAGEEPIDQFTNRYNDFMRTLLPQYGIEFYEIPRMKIGGQVISASKVRAYMKEKRYDEVRGLVLPKVYEYLAEHFFEIR